MQIAVNSFRGEAPRITPRALPDNAAQDATNARLLTGDIDAWKQFASEKVLANAPPVQTIYKLNGAWLSWNVDVDVARGAVAGDTSFRTFLTGPDVYTEPRYTNYALATTGAEPFPVVTRPLGVPPPDSPPALVLGIDSTPTTYSIDVLDEGNVLSTNWTKSASRGGSTFSDVSQDGVIGNPAPSYQLKYDEIHNEGEQPFAYRNFGTANSAVVKASVDVYIDGDTSFLQACFIVGSDATGLHGVHVGMAQGVLYIANSAGWTPYVATLASMAIPGGVTDNIWYTLAAEITVNTDTTVTVNAIWSLGATEVARLVATGQFSVGDYTGITNGTPDDSGSYFSTHYDNIHLQASGSTNYAPTNIATSYVYTFVNDIAQESAPSPVSNTILRPNGVTVTVTTPTGPPTGISSDYGITTKRIYRAVTGSSGTAFLFVAEIPLAQADYDDTLTDAQLGEPLPSELWALPPSDLRGILALPNGVMAGFSKNQLCLSAQNHPHAWPVEYRLTVDTDIVALGNIDTTVVIPTENFVYLAIGSDPAAYSMTKLEVPQACVSKRSLAYLTGIGVVFASPDGLMAVSGAGQIRNLTSTIFTREQWQALQPSTIRAIAHDDIYWFFSAVGSFALDMKQDGFGLIPVGFHSAAAFADPLTDKLFLVLDDVDEPSAAYLPLPSTAVTPTGKTIFEFNAPSGSGNMVYRWRGKLNLLPRPAAFTYCQIKAQDYTNLMLRLYSDGTLFFESVLPNSEPFTLPLDNEYSTFEFEIIGTSRVRTLHVAESVEELAK